MSKPKIISAVAEELGKFGETAKKQITVTESKDSKQETKDIVKHIYGADGQDNQKPVATETQKGIEAQKLAKLRQELHSKYYQRTFNPPKPKEETPVERVEKQKMQDLREKDEKEKKKKPIIVQRAQQSVEKYRGSSG